MPTRRALVNRLTVHRLKGPGEGSEFYIRMEKRDMSERDTFGKPLKALVAMQTSKPTEVENSASGKTSFEQNAIVNAVAAILLDIQETAERDDTTPKPITISKMAKLLTLCQISLPDGRLVSLKQRTLADRLKGIFLNEDDNGRIEYRTRTVKLGEEYYRVKLVPGETRDGRRAVGGRPVSVFWIEESEPGYNVIQLNNHRPEDDN